MTPIENKPKEKIGMSFHIRIKSDLAAGVREVNIVTEFNDPFVWDDEMKNDMIAMLADFYDTPAKSITEITVEEQGAAAKRQLSEEWCKGYEKAVSHQKGLLDAAKSRIVELEKQLNYDRE